MKKEMKKIHYVIAAALFTVALATAPWLLVFYTNLDATKLTAAFAGFQAAGAVLTAAALIAAFAQVREARKQLKDNRAWNKMSFALTYLPNVEMFFQWEEELDRTFVRLISRTDALTDPEVKQLFTEENNRTHLLLKTYLNALEAYCVAINTGLAHEETAKRIYGYKLQRHFIELGPYIRFQRTRCHDNAIYGELERVWKKWSAEIPSATAGYGEE